MRNCDRKDCGRPGVWVPKILFRLHPAYKFETKIPAYMDLRVCEEHSKDLQLSDVLTDHGWEQIKHVLSAGGIQIPDRSLTEIALATIEEAEQYWSRIRKTP